MVHLAQLNVAEMRHSTNDLQMKDFMSALAPVNLTAEQSPGFVWRLKDDSDNATNFQFFGRDDLLVNLSVWESIEQLRAFVMGPAHLNIMRRQSEWFYRAELPTLVLWWLDNPLMPTVKDAEDRLIRLRKDGPSEQAFNFANPFPSPVAM